MTDFVSRLKTEIQKGLPGTEVQWQMASSDRMLKNYPRTPGPDAKVAAVLILLFPVNGSLHTVFMQRPDYKGTHGGQISFPGGKKESGDTDIIQTALRETFEETGVNAQEISVINTLTPLFIPVSNTIVTPVIGWMNRKPAFNHHPGEVVFLFDAEIDRLLDTSIIRNKSIEIQGKLINVKYFDYDGKVIWGATAMILHELLTLIRRGNIPLRIG
ncbi:MAG TPA: CoA pyrophosphatase [Bacteroidales bacterium]|nr:CoA pyrophosphatase [Bacteroidales bacterium]